MSGLTWGPVAVELPTRLGWAIAIVLFVLLIVRDAAQELGKQLAVVCVTAVERRFAGSRAVRARSVRRYRRRVAERLAAVPVPFELPVDIPMERVYIPLRAATESEATESDGLIDLHAAVAGLHRSLVLGPPGSGKSLFLRYLLWSSCTPSHTSSSTSGSTGRPLAVRVALSRLAESGDIAAELARGFTRHGFVAAADFVRRELARDRPGLLVLFDGLDEVGSGRRASVARLITEFAEEHPRVRLVVTCRTEAYGGVLDGVVNRVLHIQPFSDELVDRFLYSWPTMSSRTAVDRLVNALRDTPRVLTLARNPLLLTMLAYLYAFEYNESIGMLPHNRTSFYRDVTELLLRKWKEQHFHYRWMDKKVVLQHLALVNQNSGADIRGMGYEATLKEITAVLPRVNLDGAEASAVLDAGGAVTRSST